MKVVIITGLTGSGKSNLAIEIAKSFNGEIISADSVQVYKGLDIGSAKEDLLIRNQIPHHLIDIKEFYETYNVSEFLSDTQSAIKTIISKGKLPIIVGGTGLYIKALLEGYSLGSQKANLELRNYYENLAKENGNEYVWNCLNEINPEKAKTVHFNNLKRVIRYIELEQNPETDNDKTFILQNYQVCSVGLIEDREIIYDKINKRVDVMLDLGLENEVKHLIDIGATKDMQSMNSIGYKEWFDYFDNKIDKAKTINLIKQHTRNYCKRQLTFLKTIPNLTLLKKEEAKNFIKGFIND